MLYENAAWDCLLNDPPFEPSLSSLKAIILIIYGRTHRGEDVFSDLQLAYRTAISTKCHIDTRQCVVEPMACEEYGPLLIGLKTLSLHNASLIMCAARRAYYMKTCNISPLNYALLQKGRNAAQCKPCYC